MAGYQRFAAYVYEYRNGKKAKNCGFIKVEVRDGKCTMEVHLQCPGVEQQETCRIYGFVRGDGLLNGIYLGSCEAGAGRVEGTITADSGNLGNSGISFARIGGVLLLTESGGFFGTEWDDQPIKPANFRELPKKEEAQSEGERQEENENRQEILPEEGDKQQEVLREDEKNRQQENIAENQTDDQESSALGSAAQKKQTENPTQTQESAEVKAEAFENEENMSEASDGLEKTGETKASETLSAAPPKPGPGPKPTMPPKPGSGPKPTMPPKPGSGPKPPVPGLIPPNPGPGRLLPPNPGPGRPLPPNPGPMPPTPGPMSPPPGPMPPKPGPGRPMPPKPPIPGAPRSMEASARPRRQFGEEFYPFEDTDLPVCWKIHPQDLPALSRRLCPMRNNRFLQYGYYNFGHLLLCRRADGKYILGVPGAYDQQERFMAGMFGFPWFKETAYIRVPKGRGGYWYRLLEAVDEG